MSRARMQVITLAIVAATMQAAVAAAAGRPALRPQAVVTADLVRIGDLVEEAGAVADIPIFRAPDLGQTGTVAVARVLEALRPHQLGDVATGSAAEISVTHAGRTVTVKELEECLAAALAGRSGLGEAKDLTLSFDRDPRPFHVEAAATGELRVSRLNFERASGRFDAAFDLPGSAAAQRLKLRYTGSVVESLEIVAPARPIARGETIRASDLVTERRPKASVGAGAFARPEHVVGLAARGALRSGQPLRGADLMKPEIVRQNETVTIVYEVPGLTLSVRGKATESGAEGDLVTVLNVQSKRPVQGTVVGPGRVAVTAMTPHVAEAQAESPAVPIKTAQQRAE
jgi:flagella basal body P-ring formation protein FlgA